MRYSLCVGLLAWAIVASGQTSAQDAVAKPNTLIRAEINDGWLLLFDGETDFGWKSDGSIKVVDGNLQIKADATKPAFGRHTAEFEKFELRFEFNLTSEASTATLRCLAPETTSVTVAAKPGVWTHFQVSIVDRRNELVWNFPAGSVLSLKNVKLRPLNLKPLFNGKDLTGWHEFPGKKSKFTVTPHGEINIKNGPGDLQTEGKYGDFVLQLECISNGKHLNSGVFFRCRPNEYQNGYEAQIRNEFKKEPTQEYTLEEYDPITHKLIAKKKAKFTAVDYGTGAIYRRQPARKEVAKDGAWFAFTILAYKNHLATWVDGIQVADWIDNRPLSDNARNGCRLEAGHISLQGHDPTTDLSFRNLRIQEVK